MPGQRAGGSAEASGRSTTVVPPCSAPVLRVSFTLNDLALTRFADAPRPLCETFIGLVVLRNQPASGGSNRWAAGARRAFPASARPLLDLVPARPPWPGFLDSGLLNVDDALEEVRATPRATLREDVPKVWQGSGRPPSWLRDLADGDSAALNIVVRALRDFYLACLAPCWPQIMATFRADVANRISLLDTGGLAEVLGSLHTSLTWQNGSLNRRWRRTPFTLDGNGVRLYPSPLWTGPPLFATQPGVKAICYSAQPAQPAGQTRLSGDLAGLLGRNRAAVLQALRTPLNTRDLAVRAGTSTASASEHASALRASGLVHTVRQGRSVCHSLTPLGRSLLIGSSGG